MGKQTTRILKNKAEKLIEFYPDKLSTDFEKNKEFLNTLGLFKYSKQDRNLIAGYITKATKKVEK